MLIVLNWKMELTYAKALQWLTAHQADMAGLRQKSGASLVICPSFETLAPAHHLLENSGVSLGAQDCSAHEAGPFTGQVSAQSLAELGCTYCIIGHSECITAGETLQETRAKLERLIAAKITPILCLGETEQEYRTGATLKALSNQWEVILGGHTKMPAKLVIAYEPRWAIGSSRIPAPADLQEIHATLKEKAARTLAGTKTGIIYGGSVDATTAPVIKQAGLFEGFLLGRASLDFQKLQKIVL